MTSEQFVWEPDQDQTYDGPSWELPKPHGSFDKACGKRFTMNSAGHTLSLLQDDGVTNWGGECSGGPPGQASIQVTQGTLMVGGPASAATLQVKGTGVAVFKSGILRIYVGSYITGSGPGNADDLVNRVYLYDTSALEIACRYNYLTSDYFQITETARIAILASDVEFTDSHVVVGTASPVDYDTFSVSSLTTESGKPASVRLTRTGIQCSGAARGVIRAAPKKSVLLNDAGISVGDDSTFEIHADAISFAPGNTNTQFQVSGATASFSFHSATPGEAPFDFMNRSYPEGLFRFMDPQPGQGARFVIGGCGNAFQYDAMIRNKLIYINDEPVTNGERLLHQYLDGDLLLKMK